MTSGGGTRRSCGAALIAAPATPHSMIAAVNVRKVVIDRTVCKSAPSRLMRECADPGAIVVGSAGEGAANGDNPAAGFGRVPTAAPLTLSRGRNTAELRDRSRAHSVTHDSGVVAIVGPDGSSLASGDLAHSVADAFCLVAQTHCAPHRRRRMWTAGAQGSAWHWPACNEPGSRSATRRARGGSCGA